MDLSSVFWFSWKEKRHFLGYGGMDQTAGRAQKLWVSSIPSPLPVSSQIDFVTWRQGRGAGVGPELSNRELCLLP